MGLLKKSIGRLFTQNENMSLQDKLVEVDVSRVCISPFQTRKEFSEEQLNELAASIKEVGIIQPPIVRFLEEEGMYELIAGERRFRASKLAGLKQIPVVVKQGSKEHSAQATLIENIQRVDLNPMETSEALRSLHDEFHWNQEQIADKVGKKRSTIANYLRLLTLPEIIQGGLRQTKITMGHAKVILSLTEVEQQLWLYNKVLRESLTVREAESVIQKEKVNGHKRRVKELISKDPFLDDISDKLRKQLATKVIVSSNKKNRGSIRIDFQNLDDLERVLELIGV
jgi:ParB family transcriptional regulator, chromosome partitioning protein